ncbi:MAG: hypothetical protein GW778_00155 [Alphaproteobacteria bacterium]|nr:hypothetical protein [Alphaproteobacteria bacterium]
MSNVITSRLPAAAVLLATALTASAASAVTQGPELDTFPLADSDITMTTTITETALSLGGYNYWEEIRPSTKTAFALAYTSTTFTPKFWDGIKEAQQARAAAGKALADSVITNLGTDKDGDTTYRVSAPEGANMSIHTPFTGTQVRDGSDTYIVKGELGEEVITFKPLDISAYTIEQVRPHPAGLYEVGDVVNLGAEIDKGKRKGSENARFFLTNDELNIGIGFPQLQEGDNVQGTFVVIKDANGQETKIDVTNFIMDAERMAALNVKPGGDGKMPEDYIVVAITEGSDGVLKQIHEALAQPGANIHFVAESTQGGRVTTEATPFGTEWTKDVVLGNQLITDGVNHKLPMSKDFSVLASVNFTLDETVNHEITSCEYLGISADKIAGHDYFIGNLEGFSGPYPRDHNVIFATEKGTDHVIAVGAPYMWGVNTENAANEGIKWSMTGSFENVALTLTPEDLRQITHGCTKDNNGTSPPPSVTYGNGTPGGFTTTSLAVAGLTDTGGGRSGGGSWWDTTTTTTTTTTTKTPSPVDGPASLIGIVTGVGALAAWSAANRNKQPKMTSNNFGGALRDSTSEKAISAAFTAANDYKSGDTWLPENVRDNKAELPTAPYKPAFMELAA